MAVRSTIIRSGSGVPIEALSHAAAGSAKTENPAKPRVRRTASRVAASSPINKTAVMVGARMFVAPTVMRVLLPRSRLTPIQSGAD
jgi:hypothetical protein